MSARASALLPSRLSSNRRRRIIQYYERSYFGWPSSFMTYELAKQLNRDRNAQLWLAIVGMTSQYLEGHLDPAEYTTLAQQVSCRLYTVTFYANLAHSLTRSP